MPVIDIVAAALSRPAGRVVEGPVRTIVSEVLRDHGYASGADVQALKDELASLKAGVRGVEDRLAEAEARADTLAREAELLREKVAALPRAPAGPPCVVDGCPAASQRSGFCVVHLGQWQAGRLSGFVTPEGLVDIDGTPFQVDPKLAGQPYEVVGTKRRLAKVAGTVVKKARLG